MALIRLVKVLILLKLLLYGPRMITFNIWSVIPLNELHKISYFELLSFAKGREYKKFGVFVRFFI